MTYKDFISKYQKAFYCTLIFANCNYWLFESMTVIQSIDSNKPAEAISTDRDTFIVSYLFPNTLIFIPILGGILIDYVGPITPLRYLMAILFIGAIILVKALYTLSLWMVVLSALFFGFTLEIINMATYIYIANTFITRDFAIDLFKNGIGVYLIFGTPVSSLGFLLQDPYISIYIGMGLIVLSYFFTSFLRSKFLVMSTANVTQRLSFDSLEYDPGRSLFTDKYPDSDTFVEHNEKFETYEVKGLLKYFKDLPTSRLVGIIAMGMWQGVYFFSYRISNFGGNEFGTTYFCLESSGYLISGIMAITMRWDIIRLNRIILIGMILNSFLMVAIGFTPADIDYYLIIAATLSNCITNGSVLLALPYYMNFNIEGFGKGFGLFRWWCCFSQFLTSNFRTNNLAFSNNSFVLGFFLPTVLCLMVFGTSLLLARPRTTRKSKITFESTIEI